MLTAAVRRPVPIAAVAVLILWVGITISARQAPVPAGAAAETPGEALDDQRPDFARMVRRQAATDEVWRAASAGHMQMDKITYRGTPGDLEIPAFVFQPLSIRGPRSHPAIVWVHENIR